MTFWLCWLAFGLAWTWRDLQYFQQTMRTRYPVNAWSVGLLLLGVLVGPLNVAFVVRMESGRVCEVTLFGRRIYPPEENS